MLPTDKHDPLRLALEVKRLSGAAGSGSARLLSSGRGWSLLDVVCTSGPVDSSFEECHSHFSVSLVVAGSFVYRSTRGPSLLTPGALLLGNYDADFECSHEHGEGDRCVSFHYDPALVEEVAADSGIRASGFTRCCLPPMRELSPLCARFVSVISGGVESTDELALDALAIALCASNDPHSPRTNGLQDERRISATVRHLEHHYAETVSIAALAERVGLSRFHFLRQFRRMTGTTPYQFLLRLRLRAAASRLTASSEPVTVIAYGVGFEDLSNFTRSFAAEFGMSPSAFRARRG